MALGLGFFGLHSVKLLRVRRLGPYLLAFAVAVATATSTTLVPLAELGMDLREVVLTGSFFVHEWLPVFAFDGVLALEALLVACALFADGRGLVGFVLLHTLVTGLLWWVTFLLAWGLLPGS